jgi:MFS family permease
MSRRWLVLGVLSAALALVSLDNTIVNVALPRLQEDLGATTAQLQWVVDAYSVVFAGSLLLAGALGDRFGRRLLLVVGLVIFIVASLGAVIAEDAFALTLCRALMGLGGACIMPSTLSILVQVFPNPHERAQAIGIWAAVVTVGLVYFALMGAMFFLPQFLQLVQGMTPLESGIAVVPGAGGLLIASLFSPRIADRIGTRTTVVLGLVVVTVGLVSFSTLTASAPYALVGGTFFLVGLGLGLTLPQATNGVLASVPPERAGMGSAVNDAMSELGGAFGVAILGAAMSLTYRRNIEEAITDAGDAANVLPPASLDAARESLASASLAAQQLPTDIASVFRTVAGDAFVGGMNWALFIGAGIVALGAVFAWFSFPARVDRVAE